MKNKKKGTESKAREIFDTLFNEKTLVKPSTHYFLGNIDSLDKRRLSGWIIDSNETDKTIDFEVCSGGDKVGEGTADIYREDLEKIGYGDGRHGFSVDLTSKIFSQSVVNIILREKDTGVLISTNPFKTKISSECVAEVIAIDGRVLSAQILNTNKLKKMPQSVEILVDNDIRLPCSLRNTAGGRLICDCQLPASLYDGMPHAYEVIANDRNLSSVAYVEILHPIVTPEEHLGDSLVAKGYAGLSRNASFRYESLHNHLLQFMEDGMVSGVELATLCQAHTEVLRGFNNRKTYSQLKLPEVTYPDVSIIIPARDKFPITYHCLASLILAQNKATFEVILADDQSADETTAAEEIVENLRVLRNELNLGFVKTNNKAVKQARGRYICLLNNDTEVTSGWIDEALSMFEVMNDVGAVGCKLIYPDGSLQEAGGIVWGSGVPWNYGKNKNASHPSFNYTRDADYLSAAALFVQKTVWEEVGGFSEEFAPAYYEDTDLAFKIRDAGYRTLYCPTSEVVHFEGKSNGTSTASGIKKYQEINSSTFREKWFMDYKNHGIEGVDPELEVDRDFNFRVLVMDADTPRRNTDAGSYAALQEMKLMMELGCKLTFVPSNFAHMGVHTKHLQKLGVETIYYPFYQTTEQFLKTRGSEFDAVYITRYSVAADNFQLIEDYTSAKVVFNNADLHFLRELREQLQSTEKDFTGPLETRDKELAVIEKSDVAICYTDAERAVITSHVMRESNVMRCPWVVQPHTDVKPFADRDGIAFLGGYAHKPNVEAVRFFCTDVMPVLTEQMPDIVFRIYGSKVPEEFKSFESNNIEVVGFVEDIDDVYQQARVFVSPLLSGAGLKGKVIDCMASGLPSVMSSVSVEGTGLVHSQSTYVAESVSEWCEYIKLLYQDEQTWQRVSENSQQVSKSLFSPAEGIKAMRKILSKVDVYSNKNGIERFKGYLR